MPTARPAKVKPVCIGPTWRKDHKHPSGWAHPKRTLGWSGLYWSHEHLRRPDGSPWVPTEEQERFFLWWYAVDKRGRFVYRDGVFQRLKGHGKDPMAAWIGCVEFVGPCRFDPANGTVRDIYGFEHPDAVPQPQAWVQVAAVSKDQTRTTMTIFPWMFSRQCIETYSINIGKEIIYAEGGARRIEAVTSSPRALEGARSTFVIRNETQHWLVNNEGHAMDRVIARNLAKAKDGQARALSITNAYEPGEESVAQAAREAWEKVQAGGAVDTGMLYDSLEAPPEAKLTAQEAPAVIEAVRGDSDWLDSERIVAEILDVRNPPSQSRRFYYNQIVATEDALITPQEWDRISEKAPVAVAPGELITLGFDGSLTDDHSALMGCRISDGFVFTLGVWDPAKHKGQAPRAEIDATVRRAFNTYDVVAFFSDVHPWESYVDAWHTDFGRDLCAWATPRHSIGWDMRNRQKDFTIDGVERFVADVAEQTFRHDADKRVAIHVKNARRRPNRWGMGFGKEHRESTRKVDSLAALILARMARRAYLALPKNRQRRLKRVVIF